MKADDIDRLTAAAAKMRRPEIHMHPDAVQQLGIANGAIADEDTEQLVEWMQPSGIAIVADESVEPGHMWLVDAAPEPLTFILPEPFDADVFASLDSMRDRWTTIGMDLGYSPSIATIATFEDGRCVDVRHFRRPRCPWKFTGRKATRARWRRMGRR
jgi:hypothetical protein